MYRYTFRHFLIELAVCIVVIPVASLVLAIFATQVLGLK